MYSILQMSRLPSGFLLATFLLWFGWFFSAELVLADLRYHGRAIHPDYPNQCYYEEMDLPVPINETIRPTGRADGRCERLFCRPDFVLEMEFCGRHYMVNTSECVIVTDLRKPFPECCPHYECERDNHI